MFQKVVNERHASAVAGDFATANAHYSTPAIGGNMVAGATGVRIGQFAASANGAPATSTIPSSASGRVIGFVARGNHACRYDVLQDGSLVIPAGQPVTMYGAGDFWAISLTAATAGQTVFARESDGAISTADGDTLSGHVKTGYKVAVGGSANELIVITSQGV